MVTTAIQRIALVKQQFLIQAIGQVAAQGDAQHRIFLAQVAQNIGAGQDVNLKGDTGVVLLKVVQKFGIGIVVDAADHLDFQMPRQLCRLLLELAFKQGQLLVHRLGSLVTLLAAGREHKRLVAALDQLLAQLQFQFFQTLAHGRLGDVQAQSGAAQAFFFHYHQKSVQQSPIHLVTDVAQVVIVVMHKFY